MMGEYLLEEKQKQLHTCVGNRVYVINVYFDERLQSESVEKILIKHFISEMVSKNKNEPFRV